MNWGENWKNNGWHFEKKFLCHVKTMTGEKKSEEILLFFFFMIYIVAEILHRKLRSTTCESVRIRGGIIEEGGWKGTSNRSRKYTTVRSILLSFVFDYNIHGNVRGQVIVNLCGKTRNVNHISLLFKINFI